MASMRYLSIQVERDRLDKETRRNVRLDEPRAVIRLSTEKGTIRDVPLTIDQLARVVEEAGKAMRILVG